jgi:hypothetical protein
MQKKQIKRPYLAPELTVVDFRVERGLQTSQVEVKPTTDAIEAYYTLLGLTGLTEDERALYYGRGMPSGNSGYFMEGGSSADGGGYFGEYF